MTLKKIVLNIHLWLGLLSGLIVFIIALTGALYAFREEIEAVTQASYRTVEEQDAPFLPPSQVKDIAQRVIPEQHLHSVLYRGKDEAIEVIFYEPDPLFYSAVYLNPYSGEVITSKDLTANFFHFILQGHYYLWLPPELGQPVVATATLIAVVILLSGIVLWWPRNKAGVKQRLWFFWKRNATSTKRKVYDLHSILGFYILSIALILALTGLVWGFQWFADAVYATAGGEKSLTYQEPPSDTTRIQLMSSDERPAIDRVWERMSAEYPNAAVIDVHVPSSPTSSIYVFVKRDEGTYWRSDYRYFDQYTLEEISAPHLWGKFEEATAADKLLRMNYDIHVGAILGLPGKILAFFASLIVASLPITGFLIWLKRREIKKVYRSGLQSQHSRQEEVDSLSSTVHEPAQVLDSPTLVRKH
jgi:uncharacterized iron-regulated membrane protein